MLARIAPLNWVLLLSIASSVNFACTRESSTTTTTIAQPVATPSPTPAPPSRTGSDRGGRELDWSMLADREYFDAITPEICQRPYRVTVWRDGRFRAVRCIWYGPDYYPDDIITGRLQPWELAALDSIASGLADVVGGSSRVCDGSVIPAGHYLDLKTNSGRNHRIWALDPSYGFCLKGPQGAVEALHNQLHEIMTRYFP